VLGAYMGGLALGAWWAGKRVERWADQRRIYAWLEVGIGLFALAVPGILSLIEPIYGWVWRQQQFSFAVFSLLRLLVAGSILLVPTVLMGATLPVLAEYLARREGRRLPPSWLESRRRGRGSGPGRLRPAAGARGLGHDRRRRRLEPRGCRRRPVAPARRLCGRPAR
jgi:hypothetical protein